MAERNLRFIGDIKNVAQRVGHYVADSFKNPHRDIPSITPNLPHEIQLDFSTTEDQEERHKREILVARLAILPYDDPETAIILEALARMILLYDNDEQAS